MTKPFTIVQFTQNEAGSELLMEMPEYAGNVYTVLAEQARRLTKSDLEGAKYKALMTLAGVTKATKSEHVSIADLRFIVDQVCDLDFFVAAPEWARKAIDAVADRRKFDEKFVNHILSAIRCIRAINQRCEREVQQHDAVSAARRGRYGNFASL